MSQQNWKAEVISIGDEIISGQRLDTNTQWLSQQLSRIGIPVHYHCSVGDDLVDHVAVLKTAMERADLIVMTGGLGPTADDLTRQAIAEAAGCELEFCQAEFIKIESRFRAADRPMPESNRLQAWFPRGSQPIPNPEGTAPGIDLQIFAGDGRQVRIMALPGVPAEMKQMWEQTVENELRRFTGVDSVFYFHTLHCFGAGESQIEAMLPGLIQRGRDPKVGITASEATISLRIATTGPSEIECQQKIAPTLATIRHSLGELVFGENGQTLTEVARQLLQQTNCRLGMIDQAFDGEIATQLASPLVQYISSQNKVDFSQPDGDGDDGNGDYIEQFIEQFAVQLAQQARWSTDCEMGLAILSNQILDDCKPLPKIQGKSDNSGGEIGETITQVPQIAVAIADGRISQHWSFAYWGHSAWRRKRAVKQVLNLLRLYLQGKC